ncbi:MAG: 1-deoxy-D-xylulose-5-phosphate reductoisomerase [Candidatus Edwardsbacteria bacterium]
MPKKVAILGSTGSIGQQCLDVIRRFPEEFEVFGLSTNQNLLTLKQQIKEFSPKIVCVTDEKSARKLKRELSKQEILYGIEGLSLLSTASEVDIVVNALVGAVGLIPTIEAIKEKKRVALANKETLVCAGELVMNLVKKYKTTLLPIDSEQVAIHQCLHQYQNYEIRRIILTASGGPFYGYSHKQLRKVTLKQTLAHPTWRMGEKITIDSATLMNKGFEVIETRWLFDVSPSQIEIVIHPQSIVHSMVEFVDGSILAQLSLPDMRLPIQYALTFPERFPSLSSKCDLTKVKNLSFLPPDFNSFPAPRLAYQAIEQGGTIPVVLNAANEIAVKAFLKGKISLGEIIPLIRKIIKKHSVKVHPELEEIIQADSWARNEARMIIGTVV